eukprot:g41560.t1
MIAYPGNRFVPPIFPKHLGPNNFDKFPRSKIFAHLYRLDVFITMDLDAAVVPGSDSVARIRPTSPTTLDIKTQAMMQHHTQRNVARLAFAAIGVIFGDIGTSPLYVFTAVFDSVKDTAPRKKAVIGALSLIIWAQILIVSAKYATFVLYADDAGEGGTFALCSLIRRQLKKLKRNFARDILTYVGFFGAALVLSDGILTPCVSVLSAVEGLSVVTTTNQRETVGITVAILVLLFMGQRFGTERVGCVFAPVMLTYFLTIGGLGVYYLWRAGPEVTKEVFGAFSPLDGVDLLFTYQGWKMLSGIVLAVTGVEALYADLGHFSREAIQLSWLFVVWPCLLLQYIGQAAAILEEPARLESPFFASLPDIAAITWFVWIVSTLAAIIASQAVITGSFSIVSQAVNFHFLPRLEVKHTSLKQEGEVYVPALNLFLGVCCVVVVLGFRTSANLTSAYGLAVTIDMALTTTFFTLWVHLVQGKSLSLALCFGIPFWCIDFLLISANVVKFLDGAWFPITTAFALGSVMAVWFTGRRWVYNSLGRSIGPKGPHQLKSFLDSLQEKGVVRMQATGVFFTPGGKPHVPISALQARRKKETER